jgi:peptidoglycan-associated lipoprotein
MSRERGLVLMVGLFLAAAGCQSTRSLDGAAAPTETADRVTAGELARPALEPVYFETDRAALREDARLSLRTHAEAIRAHPEWGVLEITGHCDERGSEEYNLALGGRRAEAVKAFLVAEGVPSGRLGTSSAGESQPALVGHDESAWRQNRRAEIAGPEETARLLS